MIKEEQLELIVEDWGNKVIAIDIIAGPLYDTVFPIWEVEEPKYFYQVTFQPSGKRPYRSELPTAPFSFPPNATHPVDQEGIAKLFADALRIHENRSPAPICNNGWEENPNLPWEM